MKHKKMKKAKRMKGNKKDTTGHKCAPAKKKMKK